MQFLQRLIGKLKIEYIFSALFIVILIVPSIIWNSVDSVREQINVENRTLAEKPSLSATTYKIFSKEYEAYLDDNLPFRDKLIQWNNAIDYFVFRRSSNPKVVIGSDGWLFSKETVALKNSSECDLYTEDELKVQLEAATVTDRFFKGRDIEFVLYIAPDKASVYGEFLPSQYTPDNSKHKQLIEFLKQYSDITIIYPRDELVETKAVTDDRLYYKTDTHWNELGAYYGTISLLKELGTEPVSAEGINFEKVSKPSFTWNGYDLSNMVGLTGVIGGEYAFNTNVLTSRNVFCTGDVYNNEADFEGSVRWYSDADNGKKLYLIRDSFAEAMSQYLVVNYDEMISVAHLKASRSEIEREMPDVVVYETVERNFEGINCYEWLE